MSPTADRVPAAGRGGERRTDLKKRGLTAVLILVLAAGLSLLLYPSLSDRWNSAHQSSAIASYISEVAGMDEDLYREVRDAAGAYNAKLAERGGGWILSGEQLRDYRNQLNVSRTGIMGYIEIPAIGCRLPICHGTDRAVLQIAAGHIEGSSLPVGGADTHCVLAGHRGLPGAKLFTDLDKLSEGDVFSLRVLDETLNYEVEKIRIVKPHEVDSLKIVKGRDLCTLVTCTPYGINSHRILVTGSRVRNVESPRPVRVTADARLVDPMRTALYVAVFFLLTLWAARSVFTVKRKKPGSAAERSAGLNNNLNEA